MTECKQGKRELHGNTNAKQWNNKVKNKKKKEKSLEKSNNLI